MPTEEWTLHKPFDSAEWMDRESPKYLTDDGQA